MQLRGTPVLCCPKKSATGRRSREYNMRYSARSVVRIGALGGSAAILACGSAKTGTISSSTTTSSSGDQSGNTSAPAALASRLQDLNSCQSRLQNTISRRIYDAYAQEVAKVDTNRDGVVQFSEADIDGKSADGQPNTRLYIAPNQFNRATVTREINDGMLAPRLAPSGQAAIMAGTGSFSSACSTGGFTMPHD